MKAEPARQLRLLDLQAIDSAVDHLTHKRATLPVLAHLTDLSSRQAAAKDHLVRAETAQSDIRREIAKADADVQLVRDRVARNRARLDAGTGSAKDLQALQHELTSLARRQSELEDIEIEVMERAERADEIVARARTALDELEGQVHEATQERDAVLGALDAELADVAGSRAGVAGAVGDDLVALYEKLRGSHSGTGAAALRQRRCLGCQLEVNAAEIDAIRLAAADQVLRCEECGRILVRTPESGL